MTTACIVEVLYLAGWCIAGPHQSPPFLWADGGYKVDLVTQNHWPNYWSGKLHRKPHPRMVTYADKGGFALNSCRHDHINFDMFVNYTFIFCFKVLEGDTLLPQKQHVFFTAAYFNSLWIFVHLVILFKFVFVFTFPVCARKHSSLKSWFSQMPCP